MRLLQLSALLLVLLLRVDSAAGFQVTADRPLPDAPQFLDRVRQKLANQYDDAILLNGYAYHVKKTQDNLDDAGKTKDREIEEHDVMNKDGLPLYRLVAKNGKPLS